MSRSQILRRMILPQERECLVPVTDMVVYAMRKMETDTNRPAGRIVMSRALFTCFAEELKRTLGAWVVNVQIVPGAVFMGAVVEINENWTEGDPDLCVVAEDPGTRTLH